MMSAVRCGPVMSTQLGVNWWYVSAVRYGPVVMSAQLCVDR